MRFPAKAGVSGGFMGGRASSVDSPSPVARDPLERDVLPLLSERIRHAVLVFLADSTRTTGMPSINEIRLRAGLPLCLVLSQSDVLFDGSGKCRDYTRLLVTQEEIRRTLSLVSDCSYYALESEFANGYITVPGGHRVGLGGQVAVWADGSVRFREVSTLSFRIARAVRGVGDGVAPKLAGKNGRLHSTLIVSPPGAGKTTLLRDLCRISGEGMASAGIQPTQVGIVDERSEIAACYGGVPQHDVGPRADVLDRCPKVKGIMMALRSLGPGVIATDEIGGDEDARAVVSAISGGATVLATCHGDDLDQVASRPYSRWLVEKGYFQKAVVLSRRLGPGTVEFVGDISGT
jgi:stage III sporulation protein AA